MSFALFLIHWLQLHGVEALATLTGFLYLYYTIKENRLLWIFGNISSALYVWVFMHASVYAYAVLYVYYVLMGFYGLYNWSRKITPHDGKKAGLRIHRTSKIGISACVLVSLVIAIPIYYVLKRYDEPSGAWMDALLTSSGMVATWMLTQKMIEQWLFWIVIDILSCIFMIYKGLYPSSFLFAAYTLLAVKGYIEWKKELPVELAK